jgi:hypothetical protein
VLLPLIGFVAELTWVVISEFRRQAIQLVPGLSTDL